MHAIIKLLFWGNLLWQFKKQELVSHFLVQQNKICLQLVICINVSVFVDALFRHLKFHDVNTYQVVHSLEYPSAILSVAISVSPVITSPAAMVAKYCIEHICVCVSVCPRAYLSNQVRDLCQIFDACCLSLWLVPPLAGWRNPNGK